MPTSQTLDQIRREILEPGRDRRYTLGGYEFVLNGLEFYLAHLGEKRHVSGQELTAGLLQFAHKQFGPLSLSVLKSWGIAVSDDFGYIVYNLIDIGVMTKQKEDSLDDFMDVVDFDEYFLGCENFAIDKEHLRRIKGA